MKILILAVMLGGCKRAKAHPQFAKVKKAFPHARWS